MSNKRPASLTLSVVEPNIHPNTRLRKNATTVTTAGPSASATSAKSRDDHQHPSAAPLKEQSQPPVLVTVRESEEETELVGQISASYSVKRLIAMGKLGKFPQSKFVIAGMNKYYTSVLNFFETCTTSFEERPTASIEFVCKVEKCFLKAKLGKLTNLNAHLDKHNESRQ